MPLILYRFYEKFKIFGGKSEFGNKIKRFERLSQEVYPILWGYDYLRSMSKRALKKFIADAPKKELENQILDLYERFPDVKKFYNFIFNPREERMVMDAKARIHNEYFPVKRKKPRARRSVAHRYIKQFKTLEMDPNWVTELMLFNLETAQEFEKTRRVPDSFYKSMCNSFDELVTYVISNQLVPQYMTRIQCIYRKVQELEWTNEGDFLKVLDQLE